MMKIHYENLTKQALLRKFNLEQLRELAVMFGLKHKRGTKGELINHLQKSKKISKSFLITILQTEGTTLKDKLRNLRKRFYEKFIERNNELIDAVYVMLGDYLVRGLSSSQDISKINGMLEQLKELANEDLPREFKSKGVITQRQRNAYYASRAHLNSLRNMLERILEESKENEHYQDLLIINTQIKNEKVAYYLTEARKCYGLKSYDATVVMLARAIEYSLKCFLSKQSISFPSRATLGNLIKLYEKYFKSRSEERVLKKILEVHNLDRIVGAHDLEQDRHFITKDEADHAWTAVQVILKELLGIEYEPFLE